MFELQPQTYPTDKARIAYLIGALRGEALTWATAVWERGSAACSDYSVFTEEMRRVFDHPVRGKEASQRLLLLSQGSRSVASFAVEFQTLAVESRWNEEALQGVFLNALGSDVKDELTSREESSDLEHLIALAIRVDNRLGERRRERAIHSAPTPSSMPPAASRVLFHRVTSGNLFWSPSPCRSDARTSPPRRGSAGFSPEPAYIVVRRATSCRDAPLVREKGRLTSNPGDTGKSCSGPLGFPSPTVCHPLVAGSDFSADHTIGLRSRRELYRPGVGSPAGDRHRSPGFPN